MNVCSSRYCQYNLAGTQMVPIPKYRVYCPFCKHAYYCSQRCRDIDWTSGHKNQCIPQNMLNSQEIAYSDKVSTLRQMKRSAEEFEVIYDYPQLGKGSFGAVRLVKDRTNGQLHAMKIMNKKDIFEYCSIENLKREIRIQRKLNHPNITQLFHYFEDKDKVYLILEYAEHGSLFQLLKRRGKLNENEALKFFKQTCLGIDYLHQQNIIHRDLKPENILLDIADNVKICDFGWSAENLGSKKRSTFCGTIDYMAPEMIEDRPHDHTLDIWCLGILLYELLHGEAPFKGKNDIEKCNNIVKINYQIIDNSLSSDVKDLIIGLIKYQQKDRLTMKQILNHRWINRNEFELEKMPISQNRVRVNGNTLHQDNQYFSKSTASSQQSFIRQNITFQTQTENSIQDYKQQYRRSRHSESQKKEIRSQTVKQKNETFMQKLLVALGCVKRESYADTSCLDTQKQ
ncbi:unnamed protein product [Paramecium pentaurelia]|uniref:Aurora kinase n=1 Tax=Paramecium pentaurelia TaxID=43138 RepID=A0A8S1W084_9CILI|nr:unnamed protein product [Paramecium pentaurelia]